MRKRRSIVARILAPLALIVAGVAIWAVVHGEVDKATKSGTSTTASTTTTKTTKAKAKHGKKVYVVKSGDVLSVIAVKNHVTIEQIEELNPKLDVNTLHTGQRITLSQ